MGPKAPSGEGEERRLRTLLRDRLFIGVLGWPPERFRSGELYDLYGLDALNDMVLYVETKSPARKSIPKSEIRRFEEKLQEVGTCENGVLTDGHRLVRYETQLSPVGVSVHQVVQVDLDGITREVATKGLSKASEATLKTAINPLRADKYLKLRPISYEEEFGRTRPSSASPDAIRKLSGHLREAADVLTRALGAAAETLFTTDMRIGSLNGTGFGIRAALDDWSTYSGRVPPSLIEEFLRETVKELLILHKKEKLSEGGLRKRARDAKKKLGVRVTEGQLSNLVSRALSSAREFDSAFTAAILDLVTPDHIMVFARQTSYVILSRLLLYRVAEDRNLVERKLSGADLDAFVARTGGGVLDYNQRARAMRKLIGDAEELMRAVFYSHLYVHGLFDWWSIPENVSDAYSPPQLSAYRRIEREVDIALEQCIRILNRFELSGIDRDIWKDVYQEYLPRNERARLGGFYTPDEVVALILDLVGYSPDAAICRSTLLDPACGSGAFIVEAAKRLRTHLERQSACHAPISKVGDAREKSWQILNVLISRLYAIDVHPFACFLTEMNFLLLTVDLLLKAKELDASRKVKELNVGCDDSLRPPERAVQLKLSQFIRTNSRADRLIKDREKAKLIKETSFDFVIGNPPWSGVLRGKLSPLFDEATKAMYKGIYDSATDKYDIYVLFVERAIDWLRGGGKLGFVTQNRFLRRKYGRGLRGVIKEKAAVSACIDLGAVGSLVFPGRTNYPCITALERDGHA